MNIRQTAIYNSAGKRDKNIIPLKIQAKGNKSAEILIYDDIGEDYYGGIGAKSFARELNALGDIDEIDLRINSAGGNVFDGVAIYNTLAKHKAHVTVNIDGMALSIASIIAMAGDTINMADNAMFMIHDPWGFAVGNAAQLREQADLMDTIKSNLVGTYAKKTGMENDKIGDLMTQETWMTADEALAFGFIDHITDAKIEKLAAQFDPKRFKNVPQDFLKTVDDAARPNLSNRKYTMARLNKVAMQNRPGRER
ncbi:MAG: Clp protease ClpP [Porticoccaceae bacterium]|nr:Clp protease ClpP [Porticoccaceae bacterium]